MDIHNVLISDHRTKVSLLTRKVRMPHIVCPVTVLPAAQLAGSRRTPGREGSSSNASPATYSLQASRRCLHRDFQCLIICCFGRLMACHLCWPPHNPRHAFCHSNQLREGPTSGLEPAYAFSIRSRIYPWYSEHISSVIEAEQNGWSSLLCVAAHGFNHEIPNPLTALPASFKLTGSTAI